MSQLNLDWLPSDRDRSEWFRLRDVQREITHRVTPKEAGYRLNMKPENLLHSLAERDRHSMKFLLHPGLCELAQRVEMALVYGNELVRPLGLVASPAVPLTAEQKLARLESTVSRLGMAGEWALKEAGLR